MIYLGLDLGQATDYTAMVAIERNQVLINRNTGERQMQLHARHAERFSLGTTYPQIVEKVGERVNAIGMEHGYMLLPDATGVGRPVVDMFRKQGLKLVPITITGGDKALFDVQLGGWRVPKRDLVSNGQVLLQNGQLKFAKDLMHGKTLIDELLNFKMKVSNAGHDSYEAWREGEHDDLVLALLMACWYAKNYGSDSNAKAKIEIPNPWLEIEVI